MKACKPQEGNGNMQRTSIDCCSDNAAHIEQDKGGVFFVDGGGQGCRLLGNVLRGDLYRGEDNLSGQFLGYRDPCLDKREAPLRSNNGLPVVLLGDAAHGPSPWDEGRGEYKLVDVGQPLIIGQLCPQDRG